MKYLKFGTLVVVLFMFATPMFGQLKNAPARVTTVLFVKLIEFEKKLCNEQLTVYVLGSSELAKELKKSIRKSNIEKVASGKTLPKTRPSVLFVCDTTQTADAIEYTRKNKVMSATDIPSLVIKGITLGFVLGEDDKPKILLNLSASSAEGCNWDPTVLTIVTLDFP